MVDNNASLAVLFVFIFIFVFVLIVMGPSGKYAALLRGALRALRRLSALSGANLSGILKCASEELKIHPFYTVPIHDLAPKLCMGVLYTLQYDSCGNTPTCVFFHSVEVSTFGTWFSQGSGGTHFPDELLHLPFWVKFVPLYILQFDKMSDGQNKKWNDNI